MATLHIGDDTYERLQRKAAAHNTTLERLLQPLLEELAGTEMDPLLQPLPPAGADREQALEAWKVAVRNRADRCPRGFVADDGRESIYEGRGE